MNYSLAANDLFWLAGWAGAWQKLIFGSMTFPSKSKTCGFAKYVLTFPQSTIVFYGHL